MYIYNIYTYYFLCKPLKTDPYICYCDTYICLLNLKIFKTNKGVTRK